MMSLFRFQIMMIFKAELKNSRYPGTNHFPSLSRLGEGGGERY